MSCLWGKKSRGGLDPSDGSTKKKKIKEKQVGHNDHPLKPHGVDNVVDNRTLLLSRENTELRADLESARQTIQEITEQIDILNAKVDGNWESSAPNVGSKTKRQKFKTINTKLKEELSIASRNFQDLKEELEKCKKERDDYRDRLSAHAATKLTDNNPNITNLGDINRPQKLAEKFSELYDNTWTDAYQSLSDQGNLKDKRICMHLLTILTTTFDTCSRLAEDQLQRLEQNIKDCIGSNQIPEHLSTHMKMYKEERKKNFQEHFPVVKQEALRQLQKDNMYPELGQDVVSYIEEASQICWLMSIQDPPMALLFCNPGEKFDKNMFKPFTKHGKTVAYMVWPTLCQYEGGPLLTKGVAQGKKKVISRAINSFKDVKQTSYNANIDRKRMSTDGKEARKDDMTQDSGGNNTTCRANSASQIAEYVIKGKDGNVVSDFFSSNGNDGNAQTPYTEVNMKQHSTEEKRLSEVTENSDPRVPVSTHSLRFSTGIPDMTTVKVQPPMQMQVLSHPHMSVEEGQQSNFKLINSYQPPLNGQSDTGEPYQNQFLKTWHPYVQEKSQRPNPKYTRNCPETITTSNGSLQNEGNTNL